MLDNIQRQFAWVPAMLLLVLASGTVFAQPFVHPGCLSTTNDFARMKAKVNASAHPWIDSYNILIGNSAAQSNAVSHAQPVIQRGSGGGACLAADNFQFAYWDAAEVYQLSLRWQITGDNNYANTAINILNAWANTCTNLCGDPNVALLGLQGYQFACAAENLRTYTNWNTSDFNKFQSFMTNVWYPLSHSWLSSHWGACATHAWANWDLCNMDTVLAIGVLSDRRDIYNEAISYYTNSVGAGAASQVMPFSHPGYLGQCQESGRDQGHCTLDPVLLGVFCEIAWNQGDDMYGYNTNELLQLSEYVTKYNVQPLNNTVPFVCYLNCDYYTWNTEYGGCTPVVASGSRGTVRPGWSLIYNHYANRRGLSAPWTGLMAAEVNAEGGGGNYGGNSGGYDQLGFTTLTHTLDSIAPASTPAPGLLIVQPRNNTVTLSWFGSAQATSDKIYRATALAGPYTNIATVSLPASSYVDIGLAPGTNYFYAVSAIVNGVETTNSTPVSATPNLQLTGTVIGSSYSYSYAGADKTCLFDGSLNNCYDALNTSGDWGGLDFGRSNVITQVAYCPRPGFSGRMVGGLFQGANVPDFSSGVVTLFTVASGPADTTPPSLTYQTISNPNAFRYVRYIGPANSSCNAAEIQFFGAPFVPTPPAAPLNLSATAGNQQVVLAWSESDTATSYNVKRGTNSGGLYTTVATNVLTTAFTDTGLSNFTNYFYVVSAVNGAGESGNSAEVSVTPTSGSRAGSVYWTGATNANWDATAFNWATNMLPVTFQNGSAVLFDDAGSLVNVSIPSSVSPASVTFNNFSKGYTLSGSPIAGSCALTLLGTSWVSLGSANTFTGGVTVDAGNVTVGNANALGSGTLTLSGGMLNNSAQFTLANNIVVGSGGGTIQLGSANNLTLNGTISGSGSLTLGNDGNTSSLYLGGANTMTGAVTVANWNNYVRFTSANAGGGNADWIFNNTSGGHTTFDFASGTIAFGSMSGPGIIQGNVNGANSMNLTIQTGGNNNSTTFSGILHDNGWGTGPIGLKKIGAGTLFLSGACDYSGQTTVTNGELIISSAFASKSTCLVTNGAAFGVTNSSAGSGTISNLMLAAGTTLEMINVTSASTPLLVASNLSVGGSCTVKITQPNSILAGNYPLANYSGKFNGAFTNLRVQLPASVTNVLLGTLVSNANQIVLSVIATTPPDAPATLATGAGNAQVGLSWSAPVGASGYNVWRSATSGSGYSFIGSTVAASYTDATAANNQTYYYVVTATNLYGTSGYSPEASATPRVTVIWSGATNANWDVSTTNWLISGSPAVYQNNNYIARFDDTARSNFTVNVSGTMSPLMMVVSNFSTNYTFSGSAIAGSGSLVKYGTYLLYLSGANTYSGGTTNYNGYIILSASTTGNVTSGPLGTGPVTMSGGYLSPDNTAVRALANALVAANGTTSYLGSPWGGKNFTLTGALTGGGTLQNDSSAQAASYSTSLYGNMSQFTGTLVYNGITSGTGANWRVGTSSSTVDLSQAWVWLNGGNAKNFGFTDNQNNIVLNIGALAGNGYFQGCFTNTTGVGAGMVLQLGFLTNTATFSGQLGVAGNNMANFSLVKVGTGMQFLTGPNIYTGQTTVSNGELVVSTAFAGNGNFLVTNNATLGVTNLSSVSALVSNLVTAAGTALEFQNVSGTTTPLVLASNLTVGGSCVVKLTGTNGFVAGGTYPLIKYVGALNGAFSNYQLQMPYGWRGTLTNVSKQISVADIAVVSTVPPPMTLTNTGSQLQLSWPSAHTGWRLQAQTNALVSGLGTNWTDIPSATYTNQITVPIVSTNGSVFYRLVYP